MRKRFETDAVAPQSESIDDAALSSAGLTAFLARPSVHGGGDLGPGTQLGDVTIIRFVAEGGMGRVYEGRQGMPFRPVAVKVVRPGVLSAAAMKRFEYEAHILGRLTHPGIARIYSAGIHQLHGSDLPYFVMEYIDDARSITTYVAERGLSTHERVTLFRDACRAVAHGHHRGVIHRDLKPGNILVDASGQTKIIDFGVARSTDGDVALTTMHTDVGQLVGTVQYMCPEQFDGAADELDVRADVYALGVVLYELLVGRLPYDVAKRPVYEVARVVKEVEPASISTINPKLRGDLNTIVAKCLEKDRGRRYSSAAELDADLGRYLRGEPIVASPPRLLDSIVRLARRHKLAATAAAFILAAIVAGGVGASIFAVQAARERAAMVREKERADAEAETSRQRLYIANLQSLQACVGTHNLRMARQLHAENLVIVGSPPPLEMSLLGAALDDALVVREWGRGPVKHVAYSTDGDLLVATCLELSHLKEMPSFVRENAYGDPVRPEKGNRLFFRVGSRQEYDLEPSPEGDWASVLRARSMAPESLGDGPDRSVLPLAVSPDGRLQARHDPDGGVRVVDVAAERGGTRIEGYRGRVSTASFSSDGSRLAIQAASGALALWDARSGRLVAPCGGKTGTIDAFHFSPDGSRIVVDDRARGRSHQLRVYDAADGRVLSTMTVPRRLGQTEIVIAFSPDGRRLITSFEGSELQLWNTDDGTGLGTLRGHRAIVTAVAFSPDGRQIASGAASGNIRLWNARTLALEQRLFGHDGAVVTLAYRPDGNSLASGSHDGTVRIWACTAAEPLAVLPGCAGMTAVAFRPDGGQLAVAPQGDGGVELWNPRTVERVCSLHGSGGTVAAIGYSPDGRLVAAAFKGAGESGDVRLWRTDTGELIATLGQHGLGAERLTFNSDGTRLLTTSGDGVVAAWDPRTGRKVMAVASGYEGVVADVNAVFGLDGSRAAYRMGYFFDVSTGDPVQNLDWGAGQVTCLATSPNGQTLAAGRLIGSVHLVDFATGKRFAYLMGHHGAVRAIAFGAGGARMVTGSLDGTARLWNVGTGEEILQFRGHEGSVEMVAFSADGRRVITSATDGTTRVWEVESGRELCSLPGQRDFPRAVAVSPDDTCLVTAATDGAIRIWGLSNAAVVRARRDAARDREITASP